MGGPFTLTLVSCFSSTGSREESVASTAVCVCVCVCVVCMYVHRGRFHTSFLFGAEEVGHEQIVM